MNHTEEKRKKGWEGKKVGNPDAKPDNNYRDDRRRIQREETRNRKRRRKNFTEERKIYTYTHTYMQH